GAVPESRRPWRHPAIPALGTLPQVLAPGELAPLGPGLAIDLDDVEGEVDHRRVRDGGPDPVGIGERVQLEDATLVDAPRDEDLHVGEAALVQLPPNLPDDRREVPPAAGRRVQADGGEMPSQGERGGHRSELLILERVDERHPWDPVVDDAVEPAPGPLL